MAGLFQFFDTLRPLSITHGNLPHWEQDQATYFVTWRTNDSLPAEVWQKWLDDRSNWLRLKGIDPESASWRERLEQLSEAERAEFYHLFSTSLEDRLDDCLGACPLCDPALSKLVEESLLFHDGKRYHLADYVIMPNHVHLLVGGLARDELRKQVTSWKRWSAGQINRLSGRSGRFWQEENYDHLVRNETAFRAIQSYIRQNPVKAGLKAGEYRLRLWKQS